jgi:hypothetical protein
MMPSREVQTLENTFRRDRVFKDVSFVFMRGAVVELRPCHTAPVLVNPFKLEDLAAVTQEFLAAREARRLSFARDAVPPFLEIQIRRASLEKGGEAKSRDELRDR